MIPAFNAAQSIGRAVDSCLRQTMGEFEILVIDDGSDDETAPVAQRLAAIDRRIRLLSLPANGGVARARNHGIDHARGQWIAVLDADDHYHPDRLQRLLEIAESSKADIVADNFIHYDPVTNRAIREGIPDHRIPPGNLIGVECFLENALPRGLTRLSSNFGLLKPIFRRRYLDERGLRYQPDMALSEDYQFYLSCLAAGGRFVLLGEAYYYYHFNRSSASKFPRIEDLQRIIQANSEFMARDEFRRRPRVLSLLRRHQAFLEKNIAFYRFKAMAQRRELLGVPVFLTQYGWALPYIMRRVASRLLASR